MEAPARALGPVSQTIAKTISEHPLEAAATAVGGGIAAYGIARMITPGADGKDHKKQHGKKKKTKRRHDPMMDILSAIVPLAIPYIAAYIEKYIGPGSASIDDKRPPQD
ncbi:MAG: hypothetical protein Q7T80_18565 [Methanoregula sp.]|nr:hypothetical protein [Methanoregula sp.]